LALQDQLTLTPLSAWDKPGRASDPGKGSVPPAYDRSQPLQFFAILNRGLNENPPPAREAALMSLFGQIGIGPDKTFRPDTLDPATARGLERAVRVGQQLIAAPFGTGSRVNGWWIPAKEIGNFGDHYLLRADVARTALAALSPEEAVDFQTQEDSQGRPLTGQHKYLLRFAKGQLPPVDAFWSVTMYSTVPDRFLVANPINRYSIGDRTRGLHYAPDGALDLYLQHESPGKENEANWLPAPAGEFSLIFRAFLPRKE